MPKAKTVVIVARTRMYGGHVCVGALSDVGVSIRLLNSQCDFNRDQDSPCRVSEIWEVVCTSCGTRKPPHHVEDTAVTEAKRVGTQKDLVGYILERAKPWKGPIDILFEGKIQFTQNGAGYISESAVPPAATGFWIPSSDLSLQKDDRGKIGYYTQNGYRHLSYVGVQNPVERIKAGQLVRVSLAGWWKPRDVAPDFEERCYAQLSGWY